jgi:hypothetical protein
MTTKKQYVYLCDDEEVIVLIDNHRTSGGSAVAKITAAPHKGTALHCGFVEILELNQCCDLTAEGDNLLDAYQKREG